MDKFCNFIIRILLEWIRADCSHWVYCNMYWALSTLSFSLDGEFIQLHWTLLCYLCGCGCNARFDSANGSMLSMGLTASTVSNRSFDKNIFNPCVFKKFFLLFSKIFFFSNSVLNVILTVFWILLELYQVSPSGMASRIWTYLNNNKGKSIIQNLFSPLSPSFDFFLFPLLFQNGGYLIGFTHQWF